MINLLQNNHCYRVIDSFMVQLSLLDRMQVLRVPAHKLYWVLRFPEPLGLVLWSQLGAWLLWVRLVIKNSKSVISKKRTACIISYATRIYILNKTCYANVVFCCFKYNKKLWYKKKLLPFKYQIIIFQHTLAYNRTFFILFYFLSFDNRTWN